MQPLTEEHVLGLLPRRDPESNKGRYGKVLCIAGCANYRGAAQLCTMGALRGGAGIVTLASTEKVIAAASASLAECVYLPCHENEQGGISSRNIPALCAEAAKSSCIVLGCGLGNTPDTAALVQALFVQSAPIVLDADGLNAVSPSLPKAAGACVITPHPGEMARLTGLTVTDIERDRPSIAAEFARVHNCTVVLKGHRTVIASQDGKLYENTTGNAGMARGGSGDLLAGMIGALLAQGLSPLDAACCGVWLHGKAGDLCAARLSQQAMLPHDMMQDFCAFLAQNGL